MPTLAPLPLPRMMGQLRLCRRRSIMRTIAPRARRRSRSRSQRGRARQSMQRRLPAMPRLPRAASQWFPPPRREASARMAKLRQWVWADRAPTEEAVVAQEEAQAAETEAVQAMPMSPTAGIQARNIRSKHEGGRRKVLCCCVSRWALTARSSESRLHNRRDSSRSMTAQRKPSAGDGSSFRRCATGRRSRVGAWFPFVLP